MLKSYKLISLVLAMLLVIGGGLSFMFQPQIARSQQASRPLLQLPTAQLIIKYRETANVHLAGPDLVNEMERLSAAAGVTIDYFRPMSGDAHVLKLPQAMPESDAQAIADRLAALPEVAYAEPDAILFPMGTGATPNDPEYNNQWHYAAPGDDHYGIDAPAAWDISTGSASVFVAVLDTGITDHPDLAGRWTGGYDFISNDFFANDGGGRDADPHDPGDWVAANECGGSHSAQDSSWHGTHVAGTIGAATNNGSGVAGVNWNSKILPVRVLGKCGGMSSDIADGMSWAAGLPVPGVPNNPNPAKVINMSLGGYGACTSTYQNVINAVVAAGATLVISSGNSDDNSLYYRPGNCDNVITVSATNRYGGRAYYSNYGATVEISAPGGAQNYANDPNGVLSTLNAGDTSPSTPNYEYYQGTSMAAPHVAGVASLLYSVDPSLTPAEVLSVLQTTATTFPADSETHPCSTPGNCGSGIVNAAAALREVADLPLPPDLQPISNADGDGAYVVAWNREVPALTALAPALSSASDATYKIYLPLLARDFDGRVFTLQEDDNSAFTSPTDVYVGTGMSVGMTGKTPGTYYYRAKATKPQGSSSWSVTRSVVVLSGTPPTATLPPTPTVPPTPEEGWSDFELQVLALANQERANDGCGVALAANDLLQQAADLHSADMVARDFFSHTNPDGKDPGDRLDDIGYIWWSWGENIAAGYSTPAAVMAGWMASSGHRANILNCDFTEIGIGHVYDAGDSGDEIWYHYWTMVLATPWE
jgi:serine protease